MARSTEDRRRYNEGVGARIREERDRAGVTQQQLERQTGIRQSTLSAIERGARQGATSEQIAKIAAALQIPTDRLLPAPPGRSTTISRAAPTLASQASDQERKLSDSREAFLDKFAAELAPADQQAVRGMAFLIDSSPGFDPDDQFWWDIVEAARRRRERARRRSAGQ